AVDFLYKPIVPEILRSKIRTFVDLYEKSEEIKSQKERLRLELENQVRNRMAELQVINQTLNSIIGASPHAIVAVDRERNVFLWNPAATRIFGWSADEVMGGKVPFVSDDKRQESDLFNQRALQGESFTNHELQRVRRDGAVQDLLVSAATMYDDKGAVTGFVTVVTDITEQKKLEMQLLRAQRLESLGTLASGIAHDLNNVLGPILMGAESLRCNRTGEQATAMISLIEESARRGSSIVKQVLTFARGVE